MTAEYAFRAQNSDRSWQSASAGTEANAQIMYPPVKSRLIALGIDPSAHVQRRATPVMIDETALPVAMGIDHQAFLREQFDRDVPLFNKVAFGTEEPIKDIWEIVPDWEHKEESRRQYAVYVVDTIWQAIPAFISRMDDFARSG